MGHFERSIQARIVEMIAGEWGKNSVVRVKHGTAYAVAGDPDLYGCLAHLKGRMFALEVKNEDGHLSAIQRYRLTQFTRAGALTGAVRDVMEAQKILWDGKGNWK